MHCEHGLEARERVSAVKAMASAASVASAQVKTAWVRLGVPFEMLELAE